MPTRSAFWRILNMVLSVRPRVGQVEALVDHREIRNDVAFHGFDDSGPIVEGWILDLAALETIVFPGSDPMNDLATPSFDRAKGAPIGRYGLSRGTVRAVWQTGNGRSDDLDRLAYLIDTNQHAVADISHLVQRHPE